MPFDVYPTPPTAPAPVPGNAPSVLFDLTERAEINPATGRNTMLVRIVKVGTGCAPGGPPHPDVRLRVDDGDPTTIPSFPATVDLHAEPGGGGDPVAAAELRTFPGDVYEVRIEVFQPGRRWQLQLVNRGPVEQRFTWVVADNAAAARQPWIDVPGALAFSPLAGQTQTRELSIANQGTGELVVADPDGSALGSGFVLVSVQPRAVPPNACAVARISVVGTAGAAPPPTTLQLHTNDSTAGATPGHNARVLLTVAAAGIWAPGDVLLLGSVGGAPALQRLDRTGPRTVPLSVGQLLATPRAAAVEPGGDAIVLDPGAFGGVGGLIRVDRFTGHQQAIATGGPLGGSTDLALECGGTVLVVGPGRRAVTRFDQKTGSHTVVTSDKFLTAPRGVAIEAGGTIVVADEGSRVVRADPADGVQVVVSSGDRLSGPVGGPRAIIVEPTGSIVAFGTVAVGSATGSFSTGGTGIRVNPLTGAQSSGMQGNFFGVPANADVDSSGAMWVCGDFALTRIDPATGARTTFTTPDGSTTITATGIATVR
jgi:hypothetical protein